MFITEVLQTAILVYLACVWVDAGNRTTPFRLAGLVRKKAGTPFTPFAVSEATHRDT